MAQRRLKALASHYCHQYAHRCIPHRRANAALLSATSSTVDDICALTAEIMESSKRMFTMFYNRGKAYHRVNRNEEAIADYERALALPSETKPQRRSDLRSVDKTVYPKKRKPCI